MNATFRGPDPWNPVTSDETEPAPAGVFTPAMKIALPVLIATTALVSTAAARPHFARCHHVHAMAPVFVVAARYQPPRMVCDVSIPHVSTAAVLAPAIQLPTFTLGRTGR